MIVVALFSVVQMAPFSAEERQTPELLLLL
jgi:hypothetical protein